MTQQVLGEDKVWLLYISGKLSSQSNLHRGGLMEPTACGSWPSEEGGYGAGSQLPLGKAV